MKIRVLVILSLLVLSCNNTNSSKEKFAYERTKEEPVIVQNNMINNNVTLNSNDQMKFDKKIECLSTFLQNFENTEYLVDYFDNFSADLKKNNLNSYLKSVNNQ